MMDEMNFGMLPAMDWYSFEKKLNFAKLVKNKNLLITVITWFK